MALLCWYAPSIPTFFFLIIVDLQCYANFCCTANWLNHTYIYTFYIIFHHGLSQEIGYSSLYTYLDEIFYHEWVLNFVKCFILLLLRWLYDFYPFFFSFFFLASPCSMRKSLGQGSNSCHSSDNARFLTHWATKELYTLFLMHCVTLIVFICEHTCDLGIYLTWSWYLYIFGCSLLIFCWGFLHLYWLKILACNLGGGL